jgi:hypothetical protein
MTPGGTVARPAARVDPAPIVSRALPPPDPNESFDELPPVTSPLSAPVAIFAAGRPSAEVDRVSEAILDLRPGALIVLVRE